MFLNRSPVRFASKICQSDTHLARCKSWRVAQIDAEPIMKTEAEATFIYISTAVILIACFGRLSSMKANGLLLQPFDFAVTSGASHAPHHDTMNATREPRKSRTK